MRRRLGRRTGFNVATLVIVAAGLVGSAARADDAADVMAAAKAWSNAVVGGDVKTVRERSAGSEAELARWDAIARLLGSFQKLTDAVKATYKDKADLSRLFQKPDFASLGTDPKVEVAAGGGEATLTTAEGKPPLKLKKDGGAWKVVLSSTPPEAAKLDAKQIEPFAEAVSATAAEITAGKYPTQAEAMKAMGQRLLKLKQGAGKG
jgi:hypothetical protein